jgi:glycosyltransferase involved in cell wall biosynthesis
LPVSESLAFGKPCIASNVTAVPEAGGTLARYFDPENLAEATAVIRAAIEDRTGLAAWEDQVRREFHARPWAEAADALLAALRQSPAAAR